MNDSYVLMQVKFHLRNDSDILHSNVGLSFNMLFQVYYDDNSKACDSVGQKLRQTWTSHAGRRTFLLILGVFWFLNSTWMSPTLKIIFFVFNRKIILIHSRKVRCFTDTNFQLSLTPICWEALIWSYCLLLPVNLWINEMFLRHSKMINLQTSESLM